MGNGYFGNMIEVDLTNKEVVADSSRHMQYVPEFIGGRGLAARLLWDALADKPGYDAMGSENPVMILPGVATGTAMSFNSRYQVCSKSASSYSHHSPYATNSTIGHAACGGQFGPDLKRSGHDLVYITGESDTPVMLFIDDDKVELIDAAEYWGKDIPACEEMVQNRYGADFSTSLIGPGGENEVRFAAVMTETARAAGRSGSAAVLGRRRFKGIICRGTKLIPVHDNAALLRHRRDMLNATLTWTGLEHFHKWGTWLNISTNSFSGMKAYKNHLYGEDPNEYTNGVTFFEKDFHARHRSCYNCATACMKFGVLRSGEHKGLITEGPDFEGGTMNGSNWGIVNGDETVWLSDYIERMGLDCIGIGGLVGFCLEAFEKGYLASGDIDNIRLEWGDSQAIMELMHRIVADEGEIYRVMARGVVPLCQYLSVQKGVLFDDLYAISAVSKNQAFPAWHAQTNKRMCFSYGVSNRGACHMEGRSAEGQNQFAVRDMGVFCDFASQGAGTSGAGWYKTLNLILNTNYSPEQWLMLGERVWMLERCLNVLDGYRRVDDFPSPRAFNPVPGGNFAGNCNTYQEFGEVLDAFYADRGMSRDGLPTAQKLSELNLDFTIPVLRRHISDFS